MATSSRFRGYAAAVLLLAIVSTATAKYSGGTGEPNDPYQIATAADLIALGNEPNDYGMCFVLIADLDLDPGLPGRKVFDKAVIAADANDTNEWFDGASFTGVFDGQGHTISHLTVTGGSYLGLFGSLAFEAQVKNLGVVDVNTTGSGNNIGGLVGTNSGGSVTRCHSGGVVRGGSCVGGLVGWESNPYSDWGWGEGGRTITDSYSTALVTATIDNAGGLVGCNEGTILRCYAIGPVAAASGASGLVGAQYGVVTACFWDTQTSGQTDGAGGTGKTTVEMQTAATFFDWGICENAGVWTIDDGRDYPRLSWERRPGRPLQFQLSDLLKGRGTPEDPYLLYTIADVNTVAKFPCEQDKHFRLMFLPGTGTPEDPYVIRSADDLDVLARCPYEQDKCFRLGFLPGQGTLEDPYVIRTAEDLDLLAKCSHEQDKYFRLGFLPGQGTLEDPYIIRTAEDLDLLAKCHHEQDKQFRLGFLPGTGTLEDPYVIRTVGDLDLLARCSHEQDKHFRLGFLAGKGTRENPYEIHAADEVDLVGRCPYERSAYFLLMADIDLSAFDGKDGRPVIHTISSFAGVFDGGGHTLSHLTTKGAGSPALFGQLASRAEVKDLGILDVNIPGSTSYAGALVGRNQGTVTRCYSTGAVTGNEYVGGLAGENKGTMTQCYSTAVTIGTSYVGGLAGWNSGSVTRCYSTAAVTGSASAGSSVGGLVGWNSGIVTECYNAGRVSGREGYVGGLVGRGGWWAAQSLWDAQTSEQSDSAGGEGKTTAEMQTVSTFLDAGWDFIGETANGTEDIWWIEEGKDYPRLAWESFSPRDNAKDISRSLILRWRPGQRGLQHDLYLGEDEAAVAKATPASPDVYRGRQPAEIASYEPTDLAWGRTYYWRVDEVNKGNPRELCKGNVWSFTVTDVIVSPDPADGATDVTPSQVLSWKPGGPGLQYDVYVGEDRDSVARATTASQGIYRGRQVAEATAYAPLGLTRGRTYYWRIDGVDPADLSRVFEGKVWGFTVTPCIVSHSPVDGATAVSESPVLGWTPVEPDLEYDVYLGEDRDGVAHATAASQGIYRGRQTAEATTYAPRGLAWGRTYYWRVDEINAPLGSTVSRSDVWTFTVEPYAYPIQSISATASSSWSPTTLPERTIDGSGLNALDQHSTSVSHMWLSNRSGPQPSWIQYQFDGIYKLDQMWVWNSNQVLESILGFGARDVTIETSLDGTAWTVLGNAVFAQAPARPDYVHNTTVDFGGVLAKFVKLTINSNWGGLIPQVGLSEVRFFYVPVKAFRPTPPSGCVRRNPGGFTRPPARLSSTCPTGRCGRCTPRPSSPRRWTCPTASQVL